MDRRLGTDDRVGAAPAGGVVLAARPDCLRLSDKARAAMRALLEAAVPLARQAGEPCELTFALGFLAADRWSAGDEAAARPLLDEGLAISRASGERANRSTIVSLLAMQAIDGGEYASAHAMVEDALATARAINNLPSVVRFLASRGLIARLRTDYPAARAAYREAVLLAGRIGERGLVMWTIGDLAGLDAVLGRPRRAVRLFGATASQRTSRSTAMILQDRNYAARLERDLAAARTALGEDDFTAEWAAGQALTLEEAIAEALADMPVD